MKIIRKHRRQLGFMVLTILFASTAIGVQRTILSIYTSDLDSAFRNYVILAPAIALSVFGMAKAIGNFTGGRLSDRYKRNWMILTGLVTLLLGSILIVFASTLLFFLIANLIIGLGVGIFLASSTVMFADLVSSKRRAKSMSLMELSVYAGTSLGSILSGFLAEISFILAFIMAFSLVAVSLVFGVLVKDTSKYGRDRSRRGVEKREGRLAKLESIWRSRISQSIIEDEDFDDLMVTLSNLQERELFEDDLDTRDLVHPSMIITFSTGLISRISDTMVILILPLLVLARGFSTLQLGIITSSFTIMWALGMFIAGPLSDQIGRKIPVIIGLVTEFVGLSLMLLPILNLQFGVNFLSIVVAGFGRGLYYAIPSSILADQVNPSQRGKILGIYRFILDFGYVVGAALLVILLEPILSDQTVLSTEIYLSAFIVVIFLLIVQTLLVSILLKDPKPQFRQYGIVRRHTLQVQQSMKKLHLAIFEYACDNLVKSKFSLDQAKTVEQKADQTLENLVESTYSGSLQAIDGIEMLEFSQKMDKALGHTLRGVKKLQLYAKLLSPQIAIRLCKFVILMDFMVQYVYETIKLLPVKVTLATKQSYHVNRIEEILDEYHQYLWEDLMVAKNNGLESLLLVKVIESLEKSANTIEDAMQIIRLIAIKHHVAGR